MKTNAILCLAAAALCTATMAQAEHTSSWNMRDRFSYSHEGELFTAKEFSFDAFGSYTTTPRQNVRHLFTDNIRHGTFGGGVGLNYFFTKYIGVGADVVFPDNGGKFVDSVSGNLILRLPIESAHLAPYIFGGGGGQFDPKDQWMADAGVGIDFRINHSTGIFVDGRFVWADKTADYGLLRTGLRFAF